MIVSKKDQVICSKCGCIIDVNSDFQTIQDKKKRTILKRAIIGGIIAILVIVGIVFGVKINTQKKAKEYSEQYKQKLSVVIYKMFDVTKTAEYCGSKIESVWRNSIYRNNDEKTDKYTKINGKFNEDFNDSLNILLNDPDFIKTIEDIKQNDNEINSLMKYMKNPPKEWSDAYKDLQDYYCSYTTLVSLCTEPRGSLNTYSSNFSKADEDVIKSFNKMKLYIDEYNSYFQN